MKRCLLLLLAVLLSAALSGFTLLDPPRRWTVDSLPIPYYVGDLPPYGLTNGEARELLVDAYAKWGDVDCSPLTAVHAGDITNYPDFDNTSRTVINHEGNLASGVNAAATTHRGSDSSPYNGVPFRNISAMNIIFNSGITWGTPEDVRAPGCFNVNSYLATGTHEIGHGLGFGHSCENGEACGDAARRGATMYWSGARCDGSREDLNEDDMAAVQAAYGASVDFTLSPEEGGIVFGAVDLTVQMDVPQEYLDQLAEDGSLRFTEFEINFGDGSDHVFRQNDGSPISEPHTYTTEGQYTISMVARGFDESCGGDFSAERRRVGDVLACDVPTAAFEYRDLGDNMLELVNTSPVGAFGCITSFEWVLDGQVEASVSTYEPTWSFDSPGTHTITLRASGPAGESEASQSVEVTETGEGCASSLAGRSAGWLLLLAPVGLLRKRR